jgi:transcription elongation factor SPT6
LQQIAVSAETLAQDFIAGVKQHFMDDPPSGPDTFASIYVDPSAGFADSDSVISGAKAILINEISKESNIRKEVRKTFKSFGLISVRPTEKGLQMVDEMHPYFVRMFRV